MAVLITRPSPDGEQLCDELGAVGIEVVYQPLIAFSSSQGCGHVANLLKEANFVIAVSKPAVEWANKSLQSQRQFWPHSTCYLAIGQKTADKLSEVTAQKVHCPEVSDSEHLLVLPHLQQINNAKVVILRGNGGRETIRTVLEQRGANVEYCEVYQRKPLLFDGHSSVKNWKNNNVTQIVLTSGDQLSYFFNRIPKEEHEWLFRQRLIVPSKRVSELAKQLGFRNIMVSGSASNPDLVAVIQQQCTTG
ncbi:uroporphyrinogen-III synthase [Vibrio sp. MA40-2]|uniref:uroporphyrinogen-III synthase n=1 Tax=Vibrio sp. MA40-2 TaxID=3391828 RepID=UPI0039A65233